VEFNQEPPSLGNQFDDDSLLREHLEAQLPPEVLARHTEEYRHLGDLGGGALLEAQRADQPNEPILRNWDAWGNRVDTITLSPLWERARVLTAEHGFVACAYEQEDGAYSRLHQFALNSLVQASLDVWSCPLAMTDGAARTLLESGNADLIGRAIPRLTSRDPATAWTSGQWMTEKTGGSDVGRSLSRAVEQDGNWQLFGTKWFTSATTSEMALTLARPAGNPEGGHGLALFYLETRSASGAMNGITIHRLKDKLGTRKVPTAEIQLEGCLATLVCGTTDGIRNIAPMLNVTRTWNAMAAVWGMRRGIALARDFAARRTVFGSTLDQKPLHQDTLAQMQASYEAAFHLAWHCVGLLGRMETDSATDADRALARVLTPIAKLTTARQAVAVASETLECFGGAGYVEDTGLPRLLADAQVLPIWEGTTNVLSLDTLRALATEGTLEALEETVRGGCRAATDASLSVPAAQAIAHLEQAKAWFAAHATDAAVLEAGARRFALALGHSFQLSCLCAHAQWALDKGKGDRAAAAARRFALDQQAGLGGPEPKDSQLLATG
jgi:alkylation response protein AidB-like acyl-CoA dehydrogenase